nr:RNA polymerase sigma factor [Enterococcus nangangensis]
MYRKKGASRLFGKIKHRRKIKLFQSQLEELFLSDYKKMYRIALSYTHNEQEAYDVISESFQKALLAFPKTKEIDNFPAWFYRILVRTGIDTWRKEQRDPEIISTEKVHLTLDDDNFGLIDRLELQQLLTRLNSPGREIILLKFFEGFTLKEIAEILDMNENTVKTTMYRTLNKLKEVLTD